MNLLSIYACRWTMIVGSLLHSSASLRLAALMELSNGFVPLMLGQIVSALAAPFCVNSASLLAARWFAFSLSNSRPSIVIRRDLVHSLNSRQYLIRLSSFSRDTTLFECSAGLAVYLASRLTAALIGLVVAFRQNDK
jgi:hypothetical protein